ncbi:MAG: ABC transporter substrate-binding protein [Anaerolineae bacterium]
MSQRALRLVVVLCAFLTTLVAACASQPAAPTEAPKAQQPAAAPPAQQAAATQPAQQAAAQPAAPTKAPQAAPASSGGDKTFTFAITANDPTSMDPAVANESQANQLVLSTYDSLVAYKPGTSEIVPRLATEWKISDDGKTYTFKLRPGVKFSSGEPLNAEAVKFSFDRLNAIGKGPSYVLAGIYDRTDVVDDMTVNVVLKSPVGHFLSMLPKVFIVNPKFVKDHATAEDKWAEKYLYDHVNGTGAFDLEKWDHNQQVVLVKKKDYWGGPDKPKIDRAVFRVIPDQSTARLLLEKGDIDFWGAGIPLDAVSQLKTNPNVVVSEDPAITALYVQVSQVKPPLDNPKVREAISYAFDYKGFIDGVYLGHAEQPQGVMAKSAPFHDNNLPVRQKDLAKAKQLLAEAGYPNGGFDLEYVAVQGDPPEKGAGLILQEGLKELGINLKVVEQTWPTMVGRMQSTDKSQLMDMYGYYRFPPYADADAYFFGPFHTSQQIKGYNGTFYGNAETDALMQKGRTTTDPAEREKIYKQLQQRLLDDTAALFVANPTSIVAYRNNVNGYKYTPGWNQTINLEDITVQK